MATSKVVSEWNGPSSTYFWSRMIMASSKAVDEANLFIISYLASLHSLLKSVVRSNKYSIKPDK